MALAKTEQPSDQKQRRREQSRRDRDVRAEERRASLRAVMELKGLTQKEWCDLAGLENSSSLGNFLLGLARTLSLETLEPLARAVNMTVSQLIGEQSLSHDAAATPDTTVTKSGKKPVKVSVEGDEFRFDMTVPLDKLRVERLIRDILNEGDPTE